MERGNSGPVYLVYKGKGCSKWRKDIELALMEDDLLNITLGTEVLEDQETKEDKRMFPEKERKDFTKLSPTLVG